MTKSLTIQISDDLEQQLSDRAAQLNTTIESLILESLQQIVEQPDDDELTKAEILAGLQRAMADAQAGRVIPVEQLWDGIDD
jgi:predicted transcriptional regulator